MLTTLLIFAAVHSSPASVDNSSHTAIVSTKRETVKVDDQELEKNVTYELVISRFEPRMTISDKAERRDFRIVHTRPEKPAPDFRMKTIWEEGVVQDGTLLNVFFALRDVGGSESVGKEIMTGIEKVRKSFSKLQGDDGILINPNVGIQPGGTTTRAYGHALQSAMLTYTINRTFEHGGKTVKQRVVTDGFEVGKIWVPLSEPIRESFAPDGQPNKEKQVSMGGITFEPITTGVNYQVNLPQLTGSWGQLPTSQSAAGYMGDVTKENGEALIDTMKGMGYSIPKMIDVLKQLAPEGTDMNALNFPDHEEDDPCAYEFDAPPGVMWIPSDSAYQTMMTSVAYNTRRLRFTDLQAMADGAFDFQSQGMRTLCMNMEKKEPAKGVKYFPYRPNDPIIPMLAKRTNESNFRGPWDQARLWIYTDKATIEDVNKVLSNGVGTSAYLMALADVGWAGGLDEKMLKDPKYIKPEFMLGSGAPEFASNFLMNTLDELHPKKAGEWLKKNATSMLQLVGPDADDDDNQHLADTLRQLTNFTAPEDRETALKFIQATQRELASLKGKLGSGRVSLYSGRNEEVTVALALVKAGYLTPAKDALAFVAESGPGDANKALAKELMDSMPHHSR